MAEKKTPMGVEEIAKLCVGEIIVEDKTFNDMLSVLDDISNLCTVKSGTATDEISDIEDKAGITLSKDQKDKVAKKYDTSISVPEGKEKAVSIIGIQARSIKKFLQVVTE